MQKQHKGDQNSNLITDYVDRIIFVTAFIYAVDSIKNYFASTPSPYYADDPETTIIETPADVNDKEEFFDLSSFKNTQYDKAVKHFVRVISDTIEEEDLNNLKRNIKSLKVEEFNPFPFHLKYRGDQGTYLPKKNTILLRKKRFYTIYHELLHMASTYNSEKFILVGFHQYDKENSISIGRGLNEGYTALLCSDLFDDCYISDGYWYLMEIMTQIEEIVGVDKMMHLYFSSDLLGLKKELLKYASEEEIIDFIDEMDWIIYHVSDEQVFKKHKYLIEECVTSIQQFIIKCNIRKIYLEYENKEIKEAKELRKKINKYLQSFESDYIFFDESVDSYPYLDASAITNEALLDFDTEDGERKRV